ncbi:hypothetical protein BH11PSE3_BH11PSE3_26150 [soil metagenome]
MRATPQPRRRPSRPKDPLRVCVLQRGGNIEAWLFRRRRPLRLKASISAALVNDARRYGQDLVEELVGGVLHDIERRAAVP